MTKNISENHNVERDISWMYFNHRILQEAEKESVPLIDRLSFLGIYSNNLDEFFRVRVASISHLLEEPSLDKASHHALKKSLKAIGKLNSEYSQEYTEAIRTVRQRLAENGIHIVDDTQLTDRQKQYLTQFFYSKLNGSVNPIWLSNIDDISTLEDNRIYLLVEKTDKGSKGKTKYAIVKVPDRQVGRWVKLPSDDGSDYIMYLDDVVRFSLPLIFIGLKESTFKAYSFKFTKDAEMELDNDQDYSTIERIAAGVDSRKRGDAVRVLFDSEMPRQMRKRILDRLDLTELDTSLASGRYQNHKDLMKFPDC